MKNLGKILLSLLCLAIFSASVIAHDSDSFTKTFPAKSYIRLKLVFGDVKIISENTDKIQVSLKYRVNCDKGSFEPVVEDDKDELYIEEDFDGNCDGSCSAYWTLIVPAKTNIDFSTASGNFDITGLDGEIDASTASGNVTIRNGKGNYRISTASGNIEVIDFSGEISANTASGEIDAQKIDGIITLSTASGNVIIDNLKGQVSASTASGDVDARQIVVSEECSFSSASGNSVVSLSSTPIGNLSVSTASGDAVVDFNGNPINGYVEFTVNADNGDIDCPMKFDEEREFRRHGEYYSRKSFTVGTNGPEIKISSSSGLARLDK
jgi:hypothetical protein